MKNLVNRLSDIQENATNVDQNGTSIFLGDMLETSSIEVNGETILTWQTFDNTDMIAFCEEGSGYVHFTTELLVTLKGIADDTDDIEVLEAIIEYICVVEYVTKSFSDYIKEEFTEIDKLLDVDGYLYCTQNDLYITIVGDDVKYHYKVDDARAYIADSI